ncbi:alpha/beta fold hydrolase [Microbulbifer thermotolerans]|uniref:Alpha/beta hydrolase n=1 Tax=Microbulbifer thermotolerans TaxID=252514 RepID=A0A143HIN6_MICTH|nr:alpha/beta hydrolase [Microbulbifer thermotolerans]AMX01340.1 alpha/beta hydrolase [Microbulbifer thermotolerans]MCX2780280.1 alpha/beta hydrolase [Microbulbifer thermotolerans]MCX2782743.1 alpha/beta hydrolase [Microbulbifer thermotolerans]MCX2795498.1 alpha/beta hydrolase [Microbulbifer thermotolerans]MCX2800211.1 alpha/beta hydrolase [Microbulbifer thermotolerans]
MRLPAVLLLICSTLLATGAIAEVQPQDAMLSGYSYPYPVKQFDLQAQQQPLTMAYMDIPPAAGKKAQGTVLLLHGKNFSGAYWKDTIDALSSAGYRLIVPDQIGFGKSSKPLNFQYSFHALADTTRALLDQLDADKVTVAGHSMGGMLATRFTLMYPERVEKLVMINPIGLEDYKRYVPYLPLDKSITREEAQTPDAVKRYMTRAYFDGKWRPSYNPLVDIQGGWTIGPDAKTIAVVDALTTDMIFTQPVVYEFPDLKAPTLLIIGTRDRTAIGRDRAPQALKDKLGRYDQLGKKTANAIPNGTLVELEGVGHVPQYEAFDRYMRAFLEFLQKS